jgi:hypothetical protein
MGLGGKRPGAGRPKGTTNVPRFSDYITDEERKKFVEFILDNYMGDMRLAQWMGDHLFIKPKQELEVGGKDGAPIAVEITSSSRLRCRPMETTAATTATIKSDP